LIAAIYDASTKRASLFFNGISVASGTFSAHSSATGPLYLGCSCASYFSPAAYYRGSIGEFRVYKHSFFAHLYSSSFSSSSFFVDHLMAQIFNNNYYPSFSLVPTSSWVVAVFFDSFDPYFNLYPSLPSRASSTWRYYNPSNFSASFPTYLSGFTLAMNASSPSPPFFDRVDKLCLRSVPLSGCASNPCLVRTFFLSLSFFALLLFLSLLV
jgi:hypothetical protein